MLDTDDKKRKTRQFGRRLDLAIKTAGISKTAVAAHCGVSPQGVSHWVKTGEMDKAYLPLVAALLGREIGWFFEGSSGNKGDDRVSEAGPPPYVHKSAALRRLTFMIESGEISEADAALLADFAQKFKRASQPRG